MNNAGILGAMGNADAFIRAVQITGDWPEGEHVNWKELVTQTFETAEECLNTNYYGAKRMVETLAPVLQLSDSARIVNISSFLGLLEVNNAGIGGLVLDSDAFTKFTQLAGGGFPLGEDDWSEISIPTVEGTKECLNINYYGAKRMVDGLLPLLQLSDSPKIVNVSSFLGSLKVNNAGIAGVILDADAYTRATKLAGGDFPDGEDYWNEIETPSIEGAKECLNTNYYGAKRMVEAFVPLLRLSDSAWIVNVSSLKGLLKNVTNEWAKGVLSDGDNVTEEKIDEVLKEYLKDFKVGSKGWPFNMSAYIISKAAMNAYTRILAKKYPNFSSIAFALAMSKLI
ncbi:hypothetical protein Ddye_017856 [Dipteronia dyeriana]|uniref:Uncharacterized protein n=1 Tax=Dipteronia dyeriana TaxID=168575 RepID=A0AAD9UA80_9ROSI|nr:hypothetical protein Ddye_017856 [Dipteronia dyeriana]